MPPLQQGAPRRRGCGEGSSSRSPSGVPRAVPAKRWPIGSAGRRPDLSRGDRKSTRLNSSHSQISYAVFCLKKKITHKLIFCYRKVFISIQFHVLQLIFTAYLAYYIALYALSRRLSIYFVYYLFFVIRDIYV